MVKHLKNKDMSNTTMTFGWRLFQAIEAEMERKRQLKTLANLLTLVPDPMVKSLIWKKFKSL